VKRVLLVTLAAVVTLAALGYGAYAWHHAITYVVTDDAYVEGTVSPVSAKVAGHVVELLVDDHRHVKQDDLLLRVDPRDYQAKVDQARAAVMMAESQLRAATERVRVAREMAAGQRAQAEASAIGAESARLSALEILESQRAAVAARRSALGAARAELDSTLALREQAQRELERVSKLVAGGLVAQRDHDQAVAGASTAAAASRAAQARVEQAERDLTAAEADLRLRESGYEPQGIGLGMARARAADARARQIQAEAVGQEVGVREAERELSAAQLRQAKANLALAELQLSYTEVRAPVEGVVSKRGVELGQVVQSGQPLMAIVPLHDVWIVANFKETQLARLQPGMRADIRVDTFRDAVFTGVVDSISAGTGARFSLLPPENATGNWVKVVQRVPVKIRLEGRHPTNPHTLRAGMSSVVTIRVR
jgi:membrane fusion protein, multidrug efflux system